MNPEQLVQQACEAGPQGVLTLLTALELCSSRMETTFRTFENSQEANKWQELAEQCRYLMGWVQGRMVTDTICAEHE